MQEVTSVGVPRCEGTGKGSSQMVDGIAGATCSRAAWQDGKYPFAPRSLVRGPCCMAAGLQWAEIKWKRANWDAY